MIAIHEPSGSVYEGVTRGDGRFSSPGMRVGGPYTVIVTYAGAVGTAFEPPTREAVSVNLGVATDLAQGRATYRLRVVNNELMDASLRPTIFLSDAYTIQFSPRYTFN